MPLINAENLIQNDPWVLVQGEQGAEQLQAEIGTGSSLIVEWALWQDNAEQLKARTAPVAVLINGATDMDALAAELAQFELVAIDFPSFADGRGFSQARLLRQRLNFSGEIRAVGDVTWDRLRYMHRCGFDTFTIAEDRYDDGIFKAFTEINVCLQGAADDPRPIYRQS